jgi:hypothetical protein
MPIAEHLRGPLALLVASLVAVIPWFMIIFWVEDDVLSGATLWFVVGLLVVLALAICVGGIASLLWLVERLENSDRWYRAREQRRLTDSNERL